MFAYLIARESLENQLNLHDCILFNFHKVATFFYIV